MLATTDLWFRYQDEPVLKGLTLDFSRHAVTGLVGANGCGKSTLGRTLMHLLPPTAGTVLFDGEDVGETLKKDPSGIRRRIQIIFQDPYGSLNPRMTVAQIVGEPLLVNGLASGKELDDRVANIFGGKGSPHNDHDQPAGMKDVDMDRHGLQSASPSFHRIRAAG